MFVRVCRPIVGHKCTMLKMEKPPPSPLSPSESPSPSPPSSFDQFRIRRRGLSNSTLTCLSVVIATAVIIACFLPIHPVNAGSCKEKEPKEGVEINETLIGMLNTQTLTHQPNKNIYIKERTAKKNIHTHNERHDTTRRKTKQNFCWCCFGQSILNTHKNRKTD